MGNKTTDNPNTFKHNEQDKVNEIQSFGKGSGPLFEDLLKAETTQNNNTKVVDKEKAPAPIASPGTSASPGYNKLDRISKLLESVAFKYGDPVPKLDPVISIQGHCILSNGNICCVTGTSKSGKSGILSAIMAGTLVEESSNIDTCGIDVTRNESHKAVVHIDTEQSKLDYYRNVNNILSRAGLDHQPACFKSYYFLPLDPKEYLEYLTRAIEIAAKECEGVFLIVIDGIGDFIMDTNNEVESKILIDKIRLLATKFKCPIIVVLHLNPGSDKLRGHLGSFMERKCESVLKVTKSKEGSKLESSLLRNGGEFDPLKFNYDEQKGYQVYRGTLQHEKDQKKLKDLTKLAKNIFTTHPEGLRQTNLKRKIRELDSVSDGTANARIREMKRLNIIAADDEHKYNLASGATAPNEDNDDLPF